MRSENMKTPSRYVTTGSEGGRGANYENFAHEKTLGDVGANRAQCGKR